MSIECERRFRYFDKENPHVYETLLRLALKMAQHRDVLSIGLLWEVMRWELMISGKGEKATNPDTGEPFALNNDYRAYYARKLMENDRRLAGRFRVRSVGLAERDEQGRRLLDVILDKVQKDREAKAKEEEKEE